MKARTRLGVAVAALSLVGTAGLVAPADAATSTGSISAGLTRVNLLNINDFHGRVDAAAGLPFACTISNERQALGADSTMLLSAGDNIGASLFVSSVQADNPTLDYLNALGLKAAAVGNHEFDRGFADLTGRVDARADFPYLGANVYQRGTQTPALDEYSVQTVNGVRVAVVGAVTPETASLVSPDGIAGIDFGDPVAAVNRVAAQLKDGNEANGEADVVVAEIHDGAQQGAGNTPAPNTIYNRMVAELAAQVDAVFNGHTHAIYTEDVAAASGTRSISQAGQYGGGLTRVQLGIDPATKRVVEYVNDYVPVSPVGDTCAGNADYVAAKAVVDAAVAQARVLGARPIGTISADITTAYADAAASGGVYTGTRRDERSRESALGNFVAQAWYDEMNVPGRPGADIGIMNPGGLRAELLYTSSAAGEGDGVVTYEEAASVNPFANTIVAKDLTGAQVKTLLEQQWQPTGAARAFLNLGLSKNLTYTFDPNRAAGDRVTSVMLNGKPIDPAATYTVASSSFLMAGGDNFTVMQQGTNTRDTGLVDTEAFMNVMARTGTVAPDFAKRGVAVLNLSAEGSDVVARVEGVDLTSLGAPVNTEFTVQLSGANVATVKIDNVRVATPLPVRDGVAELRLPKSSLPGLNNYSTMTLVAKPSGTTVVLPVTFTAPATVAKTSATCKSFGFTATGMPAGSKLRIEWQREGQRQYTTVNGPSWWSGNGQGGWTNAVATVVDAQGNVLATSGDPINPTGCPVVAPRLVTASAFGFTATGPIPAGATLKVTWTRDGQKFSATSTPPSWASGRQAGWSNAQAVVLDAAGDVIAKSAVVNPPQR